MTLASRSSSRRRSSERGHAEDRARPVVRRLRHLQEGARVVYGARRRRHGAPRSVVTPLARRARCDERRRGRGCACERRQARQAAGGHPPRDGARQLRRGGVRSDVRVSGPAPPLRSRFPFAWSLHPRRAPLAQRRSEIRRSRTGAWPPTIALGRGRRNHRPARATRLSRTGRCPCKGGHPACTSFLVAFLHRTVARGDSDRTSHASCP